MSRQIGKGNIEMFARQEMLDLVAGGRTKPEELSRVTWLQVSTSVTLRTLYYSVRVATVTSITYRRMLRTRTWQLPGVATSEALTSPTHASRRSIQPVFPFPGTISLS